MTMSSHEPSRPPVDDESSSPLPADELRPLLNMLRRARRFTLAFIRSNSPVDSRRLVEDLEARCMDFGRRLRTLDVDAHLESLYGAIADLEPPFESDQVVIILGLERAIRRDLEVTPILDRLNLERERFSNLPGGVVLVLPDWALAALAHQALDFWVWRSGFFEVPTGNEIVPWRQRYDLFDSRAYKNLSESQKEHLIRELEKLRNQHLEYEDFFEAGELSLRLAWLYDSIGGNGAVENLQRALQFFDRLGPEARHRAEQTYALLEDLTRSDRLEPGVFSAEAGGEGGSDADERGDGPGPEAEVGEKLEDPQGDEAVGGGGEG